MDWGSVAEWVGALGGVLAVFAAVVSWLTSLKIVKLEEKRDSERRIADERNQAELVTVIGVMRPESQKLEQYGIMVINGSNAPIYEVTIESQKADKSAANPELKLSVLPPGRYVIPAHPTYKWGSVIDQDAQQDKLDMMSKGRGGEMITHVTFVDAASREWELVRGRELRRIKSGTGVRK